jgi:cytochrome P450
VTAVETGVYYDPYMREIVENPYPVYQRLRDEAPLYYNEKYDFYAVSRFDDCSRGLNDWQTFPSGRGGILEIIKAGIEMPPGTVIFEDPPTHDIHRALLARAFTPRKISALEEKTRQFTAQCLDPLVGSGGFDIIAELGATMPMRVIGLLFGIPESQQDAVRENADRMLRTEGDGQMDTEDHNHLSADAIAEYVDWRIQHPADDMVTDLLSTEFTDASGARRTLTRDEVVTYATVVTGAGNETTNRLIGWLVSTLACFPEARAELVANPALIPNAVEETLRYEPPGPHIARYVAADVEFHGETVPAGSAILFIAAAANRDERRFTDPDRFDIHRQVGNQLAFGLGPHYCLGAALARLEARVALEEILKRFPTWEVDFDAAQISPTSTVRGWETLPILL